MKKLSVKKIMSMDFKYDTTVINYANRANRRLYFFGYKEKVMCDVYLRCKNIMVAFSWSPYDDSYKKGTCCIVEVEQGEKTYLLSLNDLSICGDDGLNISARERDNLIDAIVNKVRWKKQALQKVWGDIKSSEDQSEDDYELIGKRVNGFGNN